ncbi:MAG: hypothetical protein KIS96_11690 [Bauldia sp.]|nr:hypothetical protein [Bauldia sp.]
MAETWPSSLPQSLKLDDYEEKAPNMVLRSQTDMGPGKTRRRSSAVPSTLSGSMVMTQAQLITLVGPDRRTGFFGTAIQGGADRFIFPDPWGGTPLLVRFTEPPSWRAVGGGRFNVRLPLEAVP